eukprot:m.68724 g.68724  ORF g.68724 m.68724 type:complete len:559 (+) comp16009_c0_seq7:90-1766(+)
MGLRATQLSLAVAAGLALMDMYNDVIIARTLFNYSGVTAMPFLAHLIIIFGSGLAEAYICIDFSHQQLRWVLSILRLNLFRDFVAVFTRPNYRTLHPQFAQPHAVGIQAITKALPSLLLQTIFSLRRTTDIVDHRGSRGSTLPELLPNMFIGFISVAFALAAFEMDDFKHRQILLPVPYLSWKFLSLLLYRLTELLTRVAPLAVLAVAAPVETLVLTVAHAGAIVLLWNPPPPHTIRRNPQRLGVVHKLFHVVTLFFIYWDFRPNPAATVINYGPHIVLQAVANAACAARLFLLPGILSATPVYTAAVCWAGAYAVLLALARPVYAVHWSSHEKLSQTRVVHAYVSPRVRGQTLCTTPALPSTSKSPRTVAHRPVLRELHKSLGSVSLRKRAGTRAQRLSPIAAPSPSAGTYSPRQRGTPIKKSKTKLLFNGMVVQHGTPLQHVVSGSPLAQSPQSNAFVVANSLAADMNRHTPGRGANMTPTARIGASNRRAGSTAAPTAFGPAGKELARTLAQAASVQVRRDTRGRGHERGGLTPARRGRAPADKYLSQGRATNPA